MKKIWMHSVSIVAMSLAINACGKSKDASGPTVDVTPAPAKTAAQPDVKPAAPPEAQNTKDGKEDPKKSQIQTPIQEKGGSPSSDKKSEQKPAPMQEQKPVQKPEQKPEQKPAQKQEQKPEQKPTPNQAKQSPSGDSANEILSEQERQTLLRRADLFSGSADDALRSYLQTKLSKASNSRNRDANLKLASEIKRAHLQINSANQAVIFKLILDKEEVQLSGRLNADHSASLEGKSADRKSISAKVLCFDQDPKNRNCSTNLVLISVGHARAEILMRDTAISMDAVFPDHNCMSAACQNFYIFFRFTEVDLINAKTLQLARMESFEVIQGRSGFKILGVTNGEEVFSLAGPLLKSNSTATENLLGSSALDADDLRNSRGELRRTTLNDAITSLRIRGNDGRGNLQLSISTKGDADSAPDSFQLNVSRKVPETRTFIDQDHQAILN